MYQIGMQGTHLCAKPLFCNLDVATFKKDCLDLLCTCSTTCPFIFTKVRALCSNYKISPLTPPNLLT